MREFIGLPAAMFDDRELMGSKVRLLNCVALGPGTSLHRGECFIVIGTQMRAGQSERCLLLSNARAKAVPVEDLCCELLFEWPVNVRGHHDGK
jgi:hypothetical protein